MVANDKSESFRGDESFYPNGVFESGLMNNYSDVLGVHENNSSRGESSHSTFAGAGYEEPSKSSAMSLPSNAVEHVNSTAQVGPTPNNTTGVENSLSKNETVDEAIDIVLDYARRTNTSLTQLADSITVPKSSFSNWVKGRTSNSRKWIHRDKVIKWIEMQGKDKGVESRNSDWKRSNSSQSAGLTGAQNRAFGNNDMHVPDLFIEVDDNHAYFPDANWHSAGESSQNYGVPHAKTNYPRAPISETSNSGGSGLSVAETQPKESRKRGAEYLVDTSRSDALSPPTKSINRISSRPECNPQVASDAQPDYGYPQQYIRTTGHVSQPSSRSEITMSESQFSSGKYHTSQVPPSSQNLVSGSVPTSNQRDYIMTPETTIKRDWMTEIPQFSQANLSSSQQQTLMPFSAYQSRHAQDQKHPIAPRVMGYDSGTIVRQSRSTQSMDNNSIPSSNLSDPVLAHVQAYDGSQYQSMQRHLPNGPSDYMSPGAIVKGDAYSSQNLYFANNSSINNEQNMQWKTEDNSKSPSHPATQTHNYGENGRQKQAAMLGFGNYAIDGKTYPEHNNLRGQTGPNSVSPERARLPLTNPPYIPSSAMKVETPKHRLPHQASSGDNHAVKDNRRYGIDEYKLCNFNTEVLHEKLLRLKDANLTAAVEPFFAKFNDTCSRIKSATSVGKIRYEVQVPLLNEQKRRLILELKALKSIKISSAIESLLWPQMMLKTDNQAHTDYHLGSTKPVSFHAQAGGSLMPSITESERVAKRNPNPSYYSGNMPPPPVQTSYHTMNWSGARPPDSSQSVNPSAVLNTYVNQGKPQSVSQQPTQDSRKNIRGREMPANRVSAIGRLVESWNHAWHCGKDHCQNSHCFKLKPSVKHRLDMLSKGHSESPCSTECKSCNIFSKLLAFTRSSDGDKYTLEGVPGYSEHPSNFPDAWGQYPSPGMHGTTNAPSEYSQRGSTTVYRANSGLPQGEIWNRTGYDDERGNLRYSSTRNTETQSGRSANLEGSTQHFPYMDRSADVSYGSKGSMGQIDSKANSSYVGLHKSQTIDDMTGDNTRNYEADLAGKNTLLMEGKQDSGRLVVDPHQYSYKAEENSSRSALSVGVNQANPFFHGNFAKAMPADGNGRQTFSTRVNDVEFRNVQDEAFISHGRASTPVGMTPNLYKLSGTEGDEKKISDRRQCSKSSALIAPSASGMKLNQLVASSNPHHMPSSVQDGRAVLSQDRADLHSGHSSAVSTLDTRNSSRFSHNTIGGRNSAKGDDLIYLDKKNTIDSSQLPCPPSGLHDGYPVSGKNIVMENRNANPIAAAHSGNQRNIAMPSCTDTQKNTTNGQDAVSGNRRTLGNDAVGNERVLCVICQDADRSVLFLPCKHICICASCADKKLSKCPICRQNIEQTSSIYLS